MGRAEGSERLTLLQDPGERGAELAGIYKGDDPAGSTVLAEGDLLARQGGDRDAAFLGHAPPAAVADGSRGNCLG